MYKNRCLLSLRRIGYFFHSLKYSSGPYKRTADIFCRPSSFSPKNLQKILGRSKKPKKLSPVLKNYRPSQKKTKRIIAHPKKRPPVFCFFCRLSSGIFQKICLKNTKISQKLSPVQLSPVQSSSKIGRLSSLSSVLLYGGV